MLPLASEGAPPMTDADARFLQSAVAALTAYQVGQPQCLQEPAREGYRFCDDSNFGIRAQWDDCMSIH